MNVARLHRDAVQRLTEWTPPNPEQRVLRRHLLDHLTWHERAVLRSGPPAHLTVGLLVLDPTAEHVLLTHHRKADRWFQLGGHLEANDTSLPTAALREGVEESGIESLTLVGDILHLDRHALPATFGACREHLDVRYLAVAPAGTRPVVSSESFDVRWFPVDDLPDPGIEPLVACGVGRVRGGEHRLDDRPMTS